MSARLEIKSIGKSFPGVQALTDVSFAVEPGEVHALVGANGAGKSTLIKIISGVYPADRGEIFLAGRPFLAASPGEALAAGISTIYQERNFLPDRSVMFNIMLGREPSRPGGRLDFAGMRKSSLEALRRLGAEDIPLDAAAGSLTVGQKQVVEIARALGRESSLLIMDEPTSALNRKEQEALFRTVRTLRDQGMSIVYISHRLEEIFHLADRVTVLRDGKHVFTRPVRDTSSDELIGAMIGRTWHGAFPPRHDCSGEILLQVNKLTRGKSFREVSFSLRGGEVLGLTGLAGSGKEDLGRALFGAAETEAGEVVLSGKPLRMRTPELIESGIAFLPEDRKKEGIIGDLPVQRNITLPLLKKLSAWFGHIFSGKERELAAAWVEKLEIKTPSLGQLCRNLSGGNQQKVALARWLAAGPKVLILSHPTQEIDVSVKFELYNLIGELAGQGVGIIFISADVPELLGLCHTILVMHEGRLVADLPADQADEETILRYTLGQEK